MGPDTHIDLVGKTQKEFLPKSCNPSSYHHLRYQLATSHFLKTNFRFMNIYSLRHSLKIDKFTRQFIKNRPKRHQLLGHLGQISAQTHQKIGQRRGCTGRLLRGNFRGSLEAISPLGQANSYLSGTNIYIARCYYRSPRFTKILTCVKLAYYQSPYY